MKRIVLSIIALAALALSSCTQNSYEGFEDQGSVYFQTSKSDWTATSTSTNYSFAGKANDRDTIWLQVDLLGTPAEYDRTFKIGLDATTNNAVSGTHFEPFKESYIMKAGEMTTQVPVIIYKTDDMAEKTITLGITLVATNDLGLGLKGRTAYAINISNFLLKPTWWDEPFDPYAGTQWEGYFTICGADYLGPYSQRKHELFIQILGKDFPSDFMEYYSSDYWSAATSYMSNYFAENYPIYDENGNAIEPWQ